jgi:phosphoserine aminotransferase
MSRIWNFSAGPAALPEEVLKQAQEELLDWHGAGCSVMEMSHRGKEFMSIIDQAEADLRELMGIPEQYKVLFLQGGATQQFAQIPMNLLAGRSADYIVTGSWSKKALKEAQRIGNVRWPRRPRRAISPACRSPTRSARPVRCLPARLHQRNHPRRRDPGRAHRRYRRAAGGRHVVAHPVAAGGCREIRPDLRRRPEEHRPVRPDLVIVHRDLLGMAPLTTRR